MPEAVESHSSHAVGLSGAASLGSLTEQMNVLGHHDVSVDARVGSCGARAQGHSQRLVGSRRS